MAPYPMVHDNPPDYNHRTDPERFGLELRWYEGRMLLYAEWLTAFVERHRDEILMMANGSRETASLLTASKRLIVQRGSLHMAEELKDQKREIENELWYHGEEGNSNRSGIQLEWTARHAAEWRRWRIKEYLFVADHCACEIAALLRAPAQTGSDSAAG
jgi:hypothetical protein